MTDSATKIEPSHRASVTRQDVHVTGVHVTSERKKIAASFTLAGGTVDLLWEGGFLQAIDGKLSGIATRWHFDDGATLIVDGVQSGSALALADAVALAIDKANEFVVSESADAKADETARDLEYQEAADAAAQTQQAVRTRFKV